MNHLRRWGVAYGLFALWALSSVLFGLAEAAVVAQEAAQHGQPYEPAEFWARYASGYFENLQSEWAQLLVQAVFVVALARHMFAKSLEDMDALHRKVDHLHSRLDHRT